MINVKDLVVNYQENIILDRVNLTISSGDYIGIVGPNGSGKTTFIKTLLGLVGFKSGSIELFGQSAKHFTQWQRIGYLPQITATSRKGFPATVKEIIETGLLALPHFPRLKKKGSQEALEHVLELFHIVDLKNKKIGELSGGQRQRVFLARAMITKPECLILDEPTVALDPESRMNFYETLKRINNEKGTTVLLVTHDSSTVGQYADKLLYLDRKVIFYGSFKDFCGAEEMEAYFGHFAQHIICHQHHHEEQR